MAAYGRLPAALSRARDANVSALDALARIAALSRAAIKQPQSGPHSASERVRVRSHTHARRRSILLRLRRRLFGVSGACLAGCRGGPADVAVELSRARAQCGGRHARPLG